MLMKLRPDLVFMGGQPLDYMYREFPYGIVLKSGSFITGVNQLRALFTEYLEDAVPVKRKVTYDL